MRGVVSDAVRARRAWEQRRVLVLALVVVVVLSCVRDASAFTLTLAFPDGQAMTYGSACGGAGCLARGDGLHTTNAAGEVSLPGRPRTVEYRRDGIALALAAPGVASGRLEVTGDREAVVLARLLAGAAPATDAAESDLVARINEAREARGLALAQLNDRVAASADRQATWLARSAITWRQAELMHVGPFGTTLAFRQAEVSLPEPEEGGEVAEVGGTTSQALGDWMGSPPHRAVLLTPGSLLIGAARAGSFLVVQTHPPCGGCAQAGPGVRATDGAPVASGPDATAPAPAGTAPAPAGRAPTPAGTATVPAGRAPARTGTAPVTAGGGSASPCAGERLAVRRLRDAGRRMRLRVDAQCLRPGHRYKLIVRQRGRVLARRTISRPGPLTLRLAPARAARSLRCELEREGRTVAGRSLSLR